MGAIRLFLACGSLPDWSQWSGDRGLRRCLWVNRRRGRWQTPISRAAIIECISLCRQEGLFAFLVGESVVMAETRTGSCLIKQGAAMILRPVSIESRMRSRQA